jgi:peptide/nickel transport system permease protein
MLLVLLLGPWLAPFDPLVQQRELANLGPGAGHWMGTDDYGRDVFSRFLAGGQWSMLAGAGATLLVLLLGWTIGGAAGYFGGWVDAVLMRLAEVFLVVPWVYLLLGARALLPLHLPPRTAFGVVLLLIAAVSWARPARLVRGVVLSLRERGPVAAARGFGVPGPVIFWRHILPGTWELLAAQALVLLPRFVLAEVTLSFLGMGLGEPDPSWGALLAPLKQAWLVEQQWWRILPAVAMAPFFAIFALVGRGFSRLENRFTLR